MRRRDRRNPDERIVKEPCGCWIWQGPTDDDGYGSITRNGVKLRAHVFFYIRDHGPVPDGLVLDHQCDRPQCVNPAHLRPETAADNCRRGKNAKITMVIADEMRERLAAGETARIIAREHGLSETAVSLIRQGKRWSHETKPHMRKSRA